jgi:hypothetical protein
MLVPNFSSNYLPSAVLATIIMLATYTAYVIVATSNEPMFTCNQLTMRPYYLVLLYSAAFSIQMLIAMIFENPSVIVLNFINVIKLCLQNAALAAQVYEWFALYRMILFQSDKPMTTVEVERRNFKPKEKCHRAIYLAVTFIYVFLSLGFISYAVIWQI